jgi:hypothetical protein
MTANQMALEGIRADIQALRAPPAPVVVVAPPAAVALPKGAVAMKTNLLYDAPSTASGRLTKQMIEAHQRAAAAEARRPATSPAPKKSTAVEELQRAHRSVSESSARQMARNVAPAASAPKRASEAVDSTSASLISGSTIPTLEMARLRMSTDRDGPPAKGMDIPNAAIAEARKRGMHKGREYDVVGAGLGRGGYKELIKNIAAAKEGGAKKFPVPGGPGARSAAFKGALQYFKDYNELPEALIIRMRAIFFLCGV